ncbi:transketolase family protein [Granulicatella seriolae]|uniref:Alpha-ketoacid dehydrogenase subunit beta n=1 Tax=Granulicatella seriolae TaxID=2967226 RepID=A0ABT1WPC0_9LACT|nr:transketolase C-terminal domain-containing protein [Granulicatella seriolae]
MFTLVKSRKNGKELRTCVVDTLNDLMKGDKKILALDADLGAASGWTNLAKENPQQFINMGISEANMVGVAAGLSLTGYTPFIHTFGPFATRRVFDQLYISGGYGGNTINIYGSDPGFAAAQNGGTHTTWEDMALMKSIPNSVVCDAADEVQMEWIIKEFSQIRGVHYVRGNRKSVPAVYEKGSTFQLGKGNLLQTGTDVLMIVAGQLVSEALQVAERLAEKGISCEVIDMFTIKPLDKELILKEVKGKQQVVTIENHSITGGLGSSVAEVLADNGIAIPLKRIGVDERFGQVGTEQFLQEEYGLSADAIYDVVEGLFQNKKF